MKRYIRAAEDYDGAYEVCTVYSGLSSTPPDELDVISSYKGESKGREYKSYKRALSVLKQFTGAVHEDEYRGGYYGNIPVVREVGGRGDVLAYMDYNGNLVEI